MESSGQSLTQVPISFKNQTSTWIYQRLQEHRNNRKIRNKRNLRVDAGKGSKGYPSCILGEIGGQPR